MSTIKFSNGVDIPAIGFGTGTKWYKSGDADKLDEKTVDALLLALENKLYHIDTAEVYNTHLEVATALKRFFAKHPEVKREDIWITDKFTPKSISPIKAVNETLQLLGTDYLDLYLVHTPFLQKLSGDESLTLKKVWQEIEQLYEEGKVKAIGVSNFRVEDLEELNSFAKHKPVANQIEFSLVLQNQSPDIFDYSQKHDIVLQAYSPLAPVYKAEGSEYKGLHDKLDALAAKYNKSASQIALRWVLDKNVVAVTTTSKEHRVKEALDVLSFKLSPEEVEELTKIGAAAPPIRQYWSGYY